jgi:GGDEF domain-containing protein
MPRAAHSAARTLLALPQPRTGDEVTDAATLLPTRAELFVRLGERMDAASDSPAVLLLLGLLRSDDSWPAAASTLSAVTALVARSLRGDDWLARSGPSEFAVVLDGSADNAETAALRLTAAVAATGIEGLSAAAGIAPLQSGLSSSEVHRRATLCLTAARSVGAGQVIRYRGTR